LKSVRNVTFVSVNKPSLTLFRQIGSNKAMSLNPPTNLAGHTHGHRA